MWIAAVVVVGVAIGLFAKQMTSGAPETTVDGGKITRESNPDLAAAVLVAKEGLPKFKAALTDHKDGKFAVAGRFETPQGPEYLWIRVERFEGGRFHGILDLEPRLYKGHKQGDPISVAEGDVVDWMYDVGDGVQGGFTLKALSGSDR